MPDYYCGFTPGSPSAQVIFNTAGNGCPGCPGVKACRDAQQTQPVQEETVQAPIGKLPDNKCPFLYAWEHYSGGGSLPRQVVGCNEHYDTYYDMERLPSCLGDFQTCEKFKELAAAAVQDSQPEAEEEKKGWRPQCPFLGSIGEKSIYCRGKDFSTLGSPEFDSIEACRKKVAAHCEDRFLDCETYQKGYADAAARGETACTYCCNESGYTGLPEGCSGQEWCFCQKHQQARRHHGDTCGWFNRHPDWDLDTTEPVQEAKPIPRRPACKIEISPIAFEPDRCEGCYRYAGCAPAQEIDPGPGQPGVCRVCGCTDEHACETESGPCYWVEPDLCSGCVTFVCVSPEKRAWDTCLEQPDGISCRRGSGRCSHLRWETKGLDPEEQAADDTERQAAYEQKIAEQEAAIEAGPDQEDAPVQEAAPPAEKAKPEKKPRAKKVAPAAEKPPEKKTPPAAPEVQYATTGDPLADAIAKIKAEMNGAYSRAIGDFLLQHLEAHPEDAGKILAKDKTIKGSVGEIRKVAEQNKDGNCGYVSDAEGFAIVLKYYGIDGSTPRPAASAPLPPAPRVQEAKKPAVDFSVNLDDLL